MGEMENVRGEIKNKGRGKFKAESGRGGGGGCWSLWGVGGERGGG